MSATFPDPAALVVNPPGPLVRFWSSRRTQFLLVAVLSALPYLPSLNFGFVQDDAAQVLQNPLVSSWHSLSILFTHQSWSFLYPAARADDYRPVVLIWLALSRHLFGLHPAGWHFASLCLHGAIAGLLFLLLLRYGFRSWIARGLDVRSLLASVRGFRAAMAGSSPLAPPRMQECSQPDHANRIRLALGSASTLRAIPSAR